MGGKPSKPAKGKGPQRRKSSAKGGRRLSLADLQNVGGRPSSVYEGEPDEVWEDTVSKKVLSKMDDTEKKRQRVIYELIQTEQAYLRDLIVMKNLFRQSLVDANALTQDQIFGLFCNLDDVIATNGEMYESLVSRRKAGVVENIADVFVEMFAGKRFDAYEQFCANQLPASELYTALKEKNPAFVMKMDECVAKTQESRGFDLPAFLLKGMQRLLKYHPLLEQVLKRTKSDDHVQISQLTEAMQLVEEHGRRVNEKVRASENARRLLKIRDLLVKEGGGKKDKGALDFDITEDPERHLIYEGKLDFIASTADGAKTLPFHVILLSDMLLLTTLREDKYVIRAGKEPSPVLLLDQIKDVKAERKSAIESIRTTLMIELGEVEEFGAKGGRMDGPRPSAGVESAPKQYIRFEAKSQGALRNWIVCLKLRHICNRIVRMDVFTLSSRTVAGLHWPYPFRATAAVCRRPLGRRADPNGRKLTL